MADAVIETTGLSKTYGSVSAVNSLDLRVPPGSICGFVGRNGAGKTTTMKMLMGMARPDSGMARVLGLDAANAADSVAIRARTAFVSDDKQLYDAMTVDRIVRFTAAFFPQWRSDLEAQYRRTFALPAAHTVKSLSRGMRTKLALLLALCRGADLLMLDEPTSGLDPAAAEEVLQAIVTQVTYGTAVFFSSHQIAEVEQVADQIAIIDHGRTVVNGALDDLRARFCRVQLIFDGEAPAVRFATPGVIRTLRAGRVVTVVTSGNADQLVAESRVLAPASVDVSPLTLKDIFLESVVMETS